MKLSNDCEITWSFWLHNGVRETSDLVFVVHKTPGKRAAFVTIYIASFAILYS